MATTTTATLKPSSSSSSPSSLRHRHLPVPPPSSLSLSPPHLRQPGTNSTRSSPTSGAISPKRASSLRSSPCSVDGEWNEDENDEDLAFAGIVSKRRKMTHGDDDESFFSTSSSSSDECGGNDSDTAMMMNKMDTSNDDSNSTSAPFPSVTTASGSTFFRGSPPLLALPPKSHLQRGEPNQSQMRASPMSLFKELREAEMSSKGLKDGSGGPGNRGVLGLGLNLRSSSVSPAMSFDSSSVGGVDSMDSSAQSSRLGSPSIEQKKKYKKHELWASIQSDYHYLMDEEIIETCKSTESDLSWESDDLGGSGGGGSKFSLSEFIQQYKELTDWLHTIQAGIQRPGTTNSEHYLNQWYYEELLHQCPRRRLLGEYARQLVRRYPALRDEIAARTSRMNALWSTVQAAVSLPENGGVDRCMDAGNVILDVEQDMGELRRWLHSVEERLPSPLLVNPAWDTAEMTARLQKHKAIQQEIESHSQLVTAVLKLCERLEQRATEQTVPRPEDTSAAALINPDSSSSLLLVARSLERRWHTVWLSSLEWQCRLEEALAGGKVRRPTDDASWEGDDDDLTCTPVSTQTEPVSPYRTAGTVPKLQLFGTGSTRSFGTSPAPKPPRESGFNGFGSIGEVVSYSGFGTGTGTEESDTNYDILPFSENEYEKLTDHDEDFTDAEPTINRNYNDDLDDGDLSEDISYPTTDSALGRSVSDENNLGKAGRALLIKAREEAEKEELNLKKKEEEEKERMRAASGLHAMCPPPRRQGSKKHPDHHDVGYSSESHSNEEAEGFATMNPLHASSPKLELKQLESPKMRHKEVSQNLGDKKEWRQSMTSAYDTSSNCSDLAHAHDLDHAHDVDGIVPHDSTHDSSRSVPFFDTSADTTVVLDDASEQDINNVSALTATPNHSFYCMTTIDTMTDTEPSSAAEKCGGGGGEGGRGSRSGATTDAECDLSRSLDNALIEDLPYDGSFADSTNAGFSRRHHLSPHQQHYPVSNGGRIAAEGSVMTSAMTSSTSGGSHSDVTSTEKGERAMSISGGSSHDLEHAAASDPDHCANDASPKRTQPNKNDLKELTSALNKYLAKQQTKLDLRAEDVQNGNTTATTTTKTFGTKVSKPINVPAKAKVATTLPINDSFTSTDGSRRQTDDACDASSEGTGSESEESDFSTASSDNEQEDGSVLIAGKNITTSDVSRSLGSSPVKSSASSVLRAKKRKGDRPHSMADLYSLHLYGPTTSHSEGAIDSLRASLQHADNLKLRRTVSDLSRTKNDSPRKHRRRRMRRTKSDEASNKAPYSTSGGHRRSSGRSSPVPIGNASPSSLHLPRPKPSTPSSTNRAHTIQPPSNTNTSSPYYRSPNHNHHYSPHNNRNITSESDIELPRLPPHNNSSVRRRLLSPDYCDAGNPLNSTLDSFSEQGAWDNYQVPPYSSVSEDQNEEKLDASHIVGEWEHNLDFEEDFHLDSGFGSAFRDHKQVVSSTHSFPPAPASVAEDSDSDLEDFNDVIEESCKALQFTEQALQKNRKDPLDIGIFLDPAEYSDAQATCRTNIACLEEVHSTLISAATKLSPPSPQQSPGSRPSSRGPSTPTLLEEGLARVEELIERWRQVQGVAGERRQQATGAGAVWRAACQAKRTLTAAVDTLAMLRQPGRYSSAAQLEEALTELQQVRSLLQAEEPLLQESQELVDSLQLEHPSLNTSTCEHEIHSLTSALRDLLHQSNAASAELGGKLRSWYELEEIQRELEYLLGQERREFACLELARALAQSKQEIAYSLHDLELLEIALCSYEASVVHARGLYSQDVAALCTPHTHASLAATLAALHAQTAQLRAHTAQLAPMLHNAHMHAPATAAVHTQSAAPYEELVNAGVWQKLRSTLPLPVAMAIVFGAVYLLDGDGIVFSPQLHYVRGPPPT